MFRSLLPWLACPLLVFAGCGGGDDQASNRKFLPDGSLMEARQITLEPGMRMEPAWSPDGAKLAYAFVENGRCGIKIYDTKDDLARIVVPADGWASSPAWTRGGHAVLFTCAEEETSVIKKVGLTGGGPELVFGDKYHTVHARYSPDGKKMAFSTDSLGSFDLWVHDLTTDRFSRVADTKGDEFYPAWSPDGTRIAYMLVENGRSDIWFVFARSGDRKPLLTSSANEVFPNWSADGRSIYYATDRTGTYQIFRYDTEAFDTHQVTRGGNLLYPAISPDGRFLACAALSPSKRVRGPAKNWWETPFPDLPLPGPVLLKQSSETALNDEHSLDIQLIHLKED
jgi:TolB protein